MPRMATWGIRAVAGLAIALPGYAQKPQLIPSDMMGTPDTIVGFVRDTACKNASVAKDAESRKCIIQCVRAGSPPAILWIVPILHGCRSFQCTFNGIKRI